MTRNAIALLAIICAAAPALGQEVIFADDFEADTGLWLADLGTPVDQRVPDPVDSTNQVIRTSRAPVDPSHPAAWSVHIPVDMASTYVLSFRFLDESPDSRPGGVTLRVDPAGPAEYAMPFEIIADGAWHEYSFEFTPRELFDREIGSITIALNGPYWCFDGESWTMCAGEAPHYYDDFIIERTEVVPNAAARWGEVKALFR
jgi:hypothetical protein